MKLFLSLYCCCWFFIRSVRGQGHAAYVDTDEFGASSTPPHVEPTSTGGTAGIADVVVEDVADDQPVGGAGGDEFSTSSDGADGTAGQRKKSAASSSSKKQQSSQQQGKSDFDYASFNSWYRLLQGVLHSPLMLSVTLFMSFKSLGRFRNMRIAGCVFQNVEDAKALELELGKETATIMKEAQMSEVDGHMYEKAMKTHIEDGVRPSGRFGNITHYRFCTELARRNDGLYMLFTGWFSPEKDRLIVEVKLPSLEPFCTAAFRKGTGFRGMHSDIRECKLRKVQEVPDNVLVMSDTTEHGLHPFMQPELIPKIMECDLVDCVHISSRYQRYSRGWFFPSVSGPYVVIVIDATDETACGKAFDQVFSTFLKLADVAAKIRLPVMLKQKMAIEQAKTSQATSRVSDDSNASGGPVERGRKNADLERAAAERKLEKLREEKERIARLPPEQRAKLEEKERQREMKKRMTGGSKIKRMAVN
ncbi:unnamed protein product [Amoebophrya sp. A25]|nr:unnamed protein product [Amoebophrya sp. A25]|eukprot:GSA25T00016439001.1